MIPPVCGRFPGAGGVSGRMVVRVGAWASQRLVGRFGRCVPARAGSGFSIAPWGKPQSGASGPKGALAESQWAGAVSRPVGPGLSTPLWCGQRSRPPAGAGESTTLVEHRWDRVSQLVILWRSRLFATPSQRGTIDKPRFYGVRIVEARMHATAICAKNDAPHDGRAVQL
ncbi:hypothetical protein SAMN02787142_7684 [Burkholderia sp. WP9]|nr:hypothetical protein SAMN02787142_7684 [Burkholderia sp. WP9]